MAHDLVMDSFFGRLDTGPRDEHDGDLHVYRAAISKGTEEYPGAKLWEELVLRRVPPLRECIEGAVDEEDRKAHLQVLKNLVKMLAVDHMWSSARPRRTITRPDSLVDSHRFVCDHPKNCANTASTRAGRVARRARLTGQHAGYLEWSSVNRFDRCLSCDLLEFTPRPHAGYFSDVNNQDAKLARDGDFAKAESIAFMDEAIDGELKLFSVADRE